MCLKMIVYWLEKEYWINGNNDGWEIKKEVWDGVRFVELVWFWDLNKSWCLFVRCIKDGCKNVFSVDDILQVFDQYDGSKELCCDCCCIRFVYYFKYVNGDLRNIV